MKALMISNDPYSSGAEFSVRAYNDAGFTVHLVRSLMEAMEKVKTNKYSLIVVDRTTQSIYSVPELVSVLNAVRMDNPNCNTLAQGWSSEGGYNIHEDYMSSRHSDWVSCLQGVRRELSLSSSNMT